MMLRPTQIQSADAEIHGELRHEKPRQPFSGIVDDQCGKANIGAAGNANEAIAQSFLLE